MLSSIIIDKEIKSIKVLVNFSIDCFSLDLYFSFPFRITLRKKCLYSELFWSVFFPHSVRIRRDTEYKKCGKNADQNNSKCVNSFYTALITKVRPYVEKQKRVRDPISVEEKLAITLLFLATGESYKSLKHQFRISDSYGCSF